jgi:fermentation-respiration switch protein FrsA (DUF1100 family)
MDRRFLIFLVVIFAASAVVTWVLLWSNPFSEIRTDSSGMLLFSGRPAVNYTKTLLEEGNESTTYKIVYESHGRLIHALLTYPKGSGPFPAFYILPGATVTKEGAQNGLGKDLNAQGFATLAIDQRGHGETGGNIPTIEYDFEYYSSGAGSVHQEMVYDGLGAFDVLYAEPDIEKNNIFVAGESMGGRFAIIGAGIEPRIAGALLLSTSGYGFPAQNNPLAAEYLNSIDPDNYIGKISPSPILMIHIKDDQVIPISIAEKTFSLAGEPKEFFTLLSGEHGYDTYPQEGKDWIMGKVGEWG